MADRRGKLGAENAGVEPDKFPKSHAVRCLNTEQTDNRLTTY